MEDKKINEPETIIVNIDENYGDSCIKDAVNSINTTDRKPKGYVEIYSIDENGTKQKVGKSNLVLYVGREWIASRLCNVENTNISSSSGPLPEDFISWLGLGDAGTPAGDPLDPTTPVNTLTGLSNEIPINAIDTDCADFRTGPPDAYYKHPFDQIEFQQDPANENNYLIIKITTTISTLDANGYNLSEAALFTSNSDTGEHTGPFNIFSIVTFPTIVKDNSRQLVFYWYLYC